jgi:hypothetical protein
MELIYS